MEMVFFQSGAVLEAYKVHYGMGSGNLFIYWKDQLSPFIVNKWGELKEGENFVYNPKRRKR